MYDNLLDKFVSGERLTENEFLMLDNLLNDSHHSIEIFNWLDEKWQSSAPETVSLEFEQIREKIRVSYSKQKKIKIINFISRVAALLFIPLLAAALYLYSRQVESSEMLTLSTQRGEQTSVILPDGSKVWLNVDTKLSYPVNFGIKSREIEVEGEAYFEVKKNEKLPFEVTSGNIRTKALGTSFALSAYRDAAEINSSLISGSVEVNYGNGNRTLKPGQQLIYYRNSATINVQPFDESDVLAWKNEELVFRLTPFDKIIFQLEKWYNVDFVYNPRAFRSETLTVKFEKSETLENILRVMAKANGFRYKIKGKEIEIMK
jgi:ferric-dicitrate binding protein FerR (iron transport regulator)